MSLVCTSKPYSKTTHLRCLGNHRQLQFARRDDHRLRSVKSGPWAFRFIGQNDLPWLEMLPFPGHYKATFAGHSLRTSAQAGLIDRTAERSSAGILQADNANALGCYCLQFLVKLEVEHPVN